MGHAIRWDNQDQTVVLQEYLTHPSKDDLYHLAKESAEMLASVTHTVHLIVDERNYPDLILTSTDVNYLERLAPANQGTVVLVLNPQTARYKAFVNNAARKRAPHAFTDDHFVNTLDDARAFLVKHYQVIYNPEHTH